ncbi:MAG: hypothetical protein LBT13_11650 [Treponema sp.]|nr:hypothetical protein [Treponema sp.]
MDTIASYGETSGFTALEVGELELVNGGKGDVTVKPIPVVDGNGNYGLGVKISW